MIPKIALAMLAALALSVAAVAQDATALRTFRIFTDDVTLPNEPATVAELIGASDAVIRGRIVSSKVEVHHDDVSPGSDPAYGIVPETHQTVEVLEILKESIHLPIVHRTVDVIQPVGTAIVDNVRVIKDAEKVRAWVPGEEQVLFLRWDATRASFFADREDNAYLLTAGVVSSKGRFAVARDLRGLMVADFLGRVRAAAAALQHR